ncbi:MAG: hypothetical protein ABJE66_36130 [Deltaproteobacteria bacterium]
MSDPLRWQIEMTRERVSTFQLHYEWVYQHADDAMMARWSGGAPREPMSPRRRRAQAIAALVGLVATAWFWISVSPAERSSYLWFIILVAAVFVVALIAPRLLIRERRHHHTRHRMGRKIARAASRTYRGVAARAPYTIDYELTRTTVHTTAPALRVDRVFDLHAFTRAYIAIDVVCLYKGLLAVPKRMIYLGAGPERAAIVAALAAAGVTYEEISGPAPGYTAEIPPARARR